MTGSVGQMLLEELLKLIQQKLDSKTVGGPMQARRAFKQFKATVNCSSPSVRLFRRSLPCPKLSMYRRWNWNLH